MNHSGYPLTGSIHDVKIPKFNLVIQNTGYLKCIECQKDVTVIKNPSGNYI